MYALVRAYATHRGEAVKTELYYDPGQRLYIVRRGGDTYSGMTAEWAVAVLSKIAGVEAGVAVRT